MPASTNQPRFTGERLLLWFAGLLLLLGVVQVVNAARRGSLEDHADQLAATALYDTQLFPGILRKNYVSQYWDPLTFYQGQGLYRRSTTVDVLRDTKEVQRVGMTDDGRFSVYRASWVENPEGFVLKISATNEWGQAEFVAVGAQLHFREKYQQQKERWRVENEARAESAAHGALGGAALAGGEGEGAEPRSVGEGEVRED